ncbi:MAG: FkbM family methyltransferase [Betaproteobacteria bacterium]
MTPGKFLKVALRARSLAFAQAYRAAARGEGRGLEPGSYTWRAGDGADIAFRPGTSDLGLIYDILLKPGDKGEYWLPAELRPRTILDIGGNIGVASRYLAHRFPSARVHAFEPVPANVELLRRNASHAPQIQVHAFALGSADGELSLSLPDASGFNQGGYSAFAGGAAQLSVPVRRVEEALAAAGVDTVDVIKIDTEGAEFSILSAFPERVIAGASWIYGELHSDGMARAADFRTLDYLSRWFDIETAKSVRKRNYFFDACRRDLGPAFRSFRRFR